MKRPQITPGPWNFTKGITPCIRASIDRHQVNVAKTIYGSHDEALANARAIAALPALLEALEAMLEAYAPFHQLSVDHKGGEEGLHSAVRKTRAALTLAGYEF